MKVLFKNCSTLNALAMKECKCRLTNSGCQREGESRKDYEISWAARKGYIVVSSGGGGKGDTVNEVSFLYMRWDVEWL